MQAHQQFNWSLLDVGCAGGRRSESTNDSLLASAWRADSMARDLTDSHLLVPAPESRALGSIVKASAGMAR